MQQRNLHLVAWDSVACLNDGELSQMDESVQMPQLSRRQGALVTVGNVELGELRRQRQRRQAAELRHQAQVQAPQRRQRGKDQREVLVADSRIIKRVS